MSPPENPSALFAKPFSGTTPLPDVSHGRVPLDFRNQLNFLEHALHLEAFLESALVNVGLAFVVDCPGQVLRLPAAAPSRLHQLSDDFLEGVHLIVEQNDEPGIVGILPYVFLLKFFDLRRRWLYVRFSGSTESVGGSVFAHHEIRTVRMSVSAERTPLVRTGDARGSSAVTRRAFPECRRTKPVQGESRSPR